MAQHFKLSLYWSGSILAPCGCSYEAALLHPSKHMLILQRWYPEPPRRCRTETKTGIVCIRMGHEDY